MTLLIIMIGCKSERAARYSYMRMHAASDKLSCLLDQALT